MSTTTIQFRWLVGGTPTDATGVVLRDPTLAYGLRRTDSLAVLVAAGTALTRQTAGVYTYVLTDPAPGLVYQYWVEVIFNGATYRFERAQSGPPATTAPAYLTATEADALAATVPALVAWPTATAGQKTAGLVQATDDVDRAMRYQGRRYNLAPDQQPLEFPRVAVESGFRRQGLLAGPVIPPAYTDVVWDWDQTLQAPVVPRAVKLATLYQADSILGGARDERLDKQHDGVVYDQTGGLAESYKTSDRPGVDTGLTRRAYKLMDRYRLRSGRIG